MVVISYVVMIMMMYWMLWIGISTDCSSTHHIVHDSLLSSAAIIYFHPRSISASLLNWFMTCNCMCTSSIITRRPCHHCIAAARAFIDAIVGFAIWMNRSSYHVCDDYHHMVWPMICLSFMFVMSCSITILVDAAPHIWCVVYTAITSLLCLIIPFPFMSIRIR